ncbi:hypothetical protein ACN4EE_22210 [Geminocystis sp. CENA526]|uniref:hypothetical protein n=1 Tax=Geminocystis sp. CENA526 TaxID=1355871 RepID=UPI003D6F9553
MGYLKKNVNENSIKALKPNNRLQGDVPKKRLNVTIDHDVYEQLKTTGNVSGLLENLAKDYFMGKSDNSPLQVKLRDILDKIESKEKGYRSNGSGQLISDIKKLVEKL